MKNRKASILVASAALLLTCTLVTARSTTDPEGWDHSPDEVLVRYRDGVDEWRRERVRGRVNGLAVQRFRHVGIEKVLIGPSLSVQRAIELLETDPLVEFAEPNWRVEPLGIPRVTPDDPGFTSGDQWHLDAPPSSLLFLPPDVTIPVDVDVNAPEAWGVMASIFESGMISFVGVLDSGCGESGYFSPSMGYIPGHIDLPNSVLFANTAELSVIGSDSPFDANGLIDDVNGWDWVDNDNAAADEPGLWDMIPYHGTRVSGIIAARWGNDADVAGIGKGYVKVLPLRIEDVGDIVAGIEYAIGMVEAGEPVHVLNASWTSPDSQSLELAVRQAGENSIAMVAAAGNRGHSNDDSFVSVYPAEYTKIPLTNVLAVAATGTGGALAGFSNYGETSVQVAAPGENIYSTGGGAQGYTSASGTSFSAPIAAAALGLLFAAHPEMSPEEAIARLLEGGDFDYRLSGKVSSGRRVNLAGALAPFYPWSGLVLLDGSTEPVFMYTDSVSASFGTITGADSSDDSVAVMVKGQPDQWSILPVSPGAVSFTLSFEDAGAPLGSYGTGPWRVTAISPFSASVRAGETTAEPFVSLLPGEVSWSVMDPAVGSIDEDGWFTGIREGTTRVVLSVDGSPADSSGTIQVLAPYAGDDSDDPTDCFIATAAYGSALEPQVGVLREFRDRFLLDNGPGRAFVTLYYRHSPPLAELVASSGSLRLITRAALFPVVGCCRAALRFGPLPVAVILITLIILPAGFLSRRRRKLECRRL